MASHRSMLRERCLLDLVAGSSSPLDFIEQAKSLEIDLLAPWYQVMIVRAGAQAGAHNQPLAALCRQIDSIVAEIIAATGSVVSFKHGLEATILIVKGEAASALERQVQDLSGAIRRQVAAQTACLAAVGVGDPTDRLGQIAQSFGQALAQISPGGRPAPADTAASDVDAQPEQRRAADLVAKARAYIDARYADPDISLSQVAGQVQLSPAYFSVVFRREAGETFVEYLTSVRIRRAIELLRTTSLTSSEIAYQIGYHNPRYFYSVFRKVAGLPPNEFRRQA
jgi:two-component system response regulator YesN